MHFRMAGWIKLASVAFAAGLVFISSGLAASPEEKLVKLQIEEVDYLNRYSPGNPRLTEVQAEIKSLKATGNLENQKYYDFLQAELMRLKIDRGMLAQRYRSGSPKIIQVEAQIAFIQNKLKEKSI